MCAGSAFAKNNAPQTGLYSADGLVISINSNQPSLACPATAGASFTGVLEFDNGKGFVLRQGSNIAGGAAIFEEQFLPGRRAPTSTNHGGNTSTGTSGNYSFGAIGAIPGIGTYVATLTPADAASFVLSVTLTYPFSVGGTTATCTEVDQFTLLRTGT